MEYSEAALEAGTLLDTQTLHYYFSLGTYGTEDVLYLETFLLVLVLKLLNRWNSVLSRNLEIRARRNKELFNKKSNIIFY